MSCDWHLLDGVYFIRDHSVNYGLIFGKVRPASTYAYRVQRRGGKVAVFNLEPSVGDDHADFLFRGPCEVQLSRVFPELSTAWETNESVSANSNHLKWASSECFQCI